MPEPTAPTDDVGRWQRISVAVVALVLVVHAVLLVLWLAPSSPVRNAVGDARLSTYVDPYFRQGDDTVGIGSNRVDESLQLRAAVRPEGGGTSSVTDWIDVTALENKRTRADLEPARAHEIARRIATNVNFAVLALTPEQQRVVARTAADVPVARLQRQLGSAGSDASDVRNFMAQDQMATQFASLWLGAAYPDAEVLQVQYRVGRRVVPSFSERDSATLSGTDFAYFRVGWRAAHRAGPEARQIFAEYVEAADRG
jgi:hypothetical protein